MIFLIRHGESEANAGLPTSCPESGGLTERGREQAQNVAVFLSYYPLELIITSPYRRAIQTAEPTSFVFHNTPERLITEEVQPVQEFTYLEPERWTCSTPAQRRPEVERYWQKADPEDADGLGAESFKDFIERVRKFLKRLEDVQEKYENVAIFSHEQFINAALWLIDRKPAGISSTTMREFRTYLDNNHIPNGAIVQLQFSPWDNCWKHEVVTAHLKNRTPVAAD
ncbi:MAG TPA: histidine phosphatase family protein [Ktedonobacteraceae bacterium]|nr:histidine phosphatase family protein [Ktedonobacteraceae bacterium]